MTLGEPPLLEADIKPSICPEKNCECINNTCYEVEPDGNTLERGYTFFCLGEMIDPKKFTVGEVEHENDLHLCIWTPLRGWVKLMINEHDIFLIEVAFQSLRKKRGYPLLTTRPTDPTPKPSTSNNLIKKKKKPEDTPE